jgi:predicted SAM-dependent methyltransferase
MFYHKAKQILLLLIPKNILLKLENRLRRLFALPYKGDGVYCPICAMEFRKFIPLNPNKVKTNYLCPQCGSAQRQRLLYLYLSAKCLILTEPINLLHFSPRPCLINKLKQIPGLTYVTSDPTAKNMDRNHDLTDIDEGDNSYDLIVCYHILEHIIEDRKAMQEIFRILKPSGTALFQVPFWDKETYEDSALTSPEQRLKAFGQKDHVRIYGYQDFINRLSNAGFQVTPVTYAKQLGPKICTKYGLDEEEVIFVCRKNNVLSSN